MSKHRVRVVFIQEATYEIDLDAPEYEGLTLEEACEADRECAQEGHFNFECTDFFIEPD